MHSLHIEGYNMAKNNFPAKVTFKCYIKCVMYYNYNFNIPSICYITLLAWMKRNIARLTVSYLRTYELFQNKDIYNVIHMSKV